MSGSRPAHPGNRIAMLLDLTRLKGSREHFERTLQPSLFEPRDPDYRVAAPVVLSMYIAKAGEDTFTVTGRAQSRLALECSRCLEEFEIPVDATFELRYLPQAQNVGDPEQEIADEDLETAYYRDGSLDVLDLVREQFELALPMKPLHDEACRGLCSECGANLNRTDCGHAPTWEDPRLAPLKGLLNRSKE
jgi:uncharacterized protein